MIGGKNFLISGVPVHVDGLIWQDWTERYAQAVISSYAFDLRKGVKYMQCDPYPQRYGKIMSDEGVEKLMAKTFATKNEYMKHLPMALNTDKYREWSMTVQLQDALGKDKNVRNLVAAGIEQMKEDLKMKVRVHVDTEFGLDVKFIPHLDIPRQMYYTFGDFLVHIPDICHPDQEILIGKAVY